MSSFNISPRNPRGFTLIELMIVVAVIGILAAIAYPSYRDSVIRSNRNVAKGDLQGLAQAMERWRVQNNTFLGAAASAADTGAPAIFPTKSPLDGTKTVYNLTIHAATATTFTIRATPTTTGQNKDDGYLQLQENNAREWVKGGVTKTTWEDN
jgi:type IV pilus assembly protein PilE